MRRITRIRVTGVVQGVGFRPFVYGLATRLGIEGYCLNDGEGVTIELVADASGPDVAGFVSELRRSAPLLSRIDAISIEGVQTPGLKGPKSPKNGFVIRESLAQGNGFALISPDISVCPDCLKELFDPGDRRHRYPFINCTNCGPRYSIVRDVPYDRANTTMAGFRMCPECEGEYRDPANRRFHAEPTACAVCGPKTWLTDNAGKAADGVNYIAIQKARQLIKDGAIIAVRGLGGFHFACDASNDGAVGRLRDKKRKSNKPFAVMSPDAEAIRAYARVKDDEARLLRSNVSPIVLLEKRPGGPLGACVAPGNARVGVMLPYTPLHHLLLRGEANAFTALVMTSGNLSEEPIVISNEDALEKLSPIADCFLLHDRDIYMRVDDSITRMEAGSPVLLRRSRGFTPDVLELNAELKEIFAAGAGLKNTLTITKGTKAITSQHLGDMENPACLAFFEETFKNLKNTFRAEPLIVAHDMHPDYLGTRFALDYAREKGIDPRFVVPVQHHHAHAVSVMAEHGLKNSVIAIIFDGTGMGTDGCVWGGEFFIADRKGFERRAHLDYTPLPGGDMAAIQPWRMGLAYIAKGFGDGAEDVVERLYKRIDPKKTGMVLKMIKAGLNSPLSSSAGRLFDAVSSMLGLRDEITFEAEAAMDLEFIADVTGPMAKTPYDFSFVNIGNSGGDSGPMRVDTAPIIRGAVNDLDAGVEKGVISARFHYTLSEIILNAANILKHGTGIKDVVLTGGVFQNALLFSMATKRLSGAGFKVWYNERYPTNDGGVSLGQAICAWERVKGFF